MQLLVNIDVDDLGKAIAFYQAAFALRPARCFGDQGVEMLGAEAPIYLLLKAAGTPATKTLEQRRSYTRHWTPVHLDFVVPDLHAALSRALSAGAQLEGEVHTHVWGSIAHLADPFGHGICLIEFHGQGYDEICDPA